MSAEKQYTEAIINQDIKVDFEIITPKKAREYLRVNIENNRPISPKWVDTICDLMARGKWQENGEAIKFQKPNGDGVEHLIDGQHRLHAIIKMKEPRRCMVIRNLERETFLTIDAGRKRTAADVLAIAGYKQSTTLAASVRLLVAFERDWRFANNFKAVPSTDIIEMLRIFPTIEDSVHVGHKGRFVVPGSHLVFLHFILSQDNPRQADEFIEKVTEGTDMEKGNPILTLRERIFRYKATNVRLRKQFVLGLLIKTWNNWYQGKEIYKLHFALDEEFPKIDGFDRKKLFGSDYPDESIHKKDNKGGLSTNKQRELFK